MINIPEQQAAYERDLESALVRLRAGKTRVRVPQSVELHRKRPRSHFHPVPELFVQTGGATVFECPADRFTLGAGELAVMPRGVPHAETPVDRRTPYGVLVCIHAQEGFVLHRGRATADREIQGWGSERLVSVRGREAFRYLDDVAEADKVPVVHRERYVAGLVDAFVVTLLSELHRPAVVSDARSPFVREAEKLARTMLADPELSVERLAASAGCATDTLSRQFHRERGVTLTTWITKERVTLAKDLLADARYNVAEVGWACGFSTASYFIRVFRTHTGMTPREWRVVERRSVTG
ncbi:helix-turn-helix transcriptional regulator [Rariglobus hedericola]|uniref:Helix-turn-helix transcriptional regulator n=1 Tax=Rariglobus hedericola TaxID=2597822 RepID=A0A556QRB1_9BACT|nr:AraC family transcriptional regulator [Rariglobus hedericola]TSJ79177.1 helix-turn-helix transcriptional regulator [Rariglobus hedericola]